jgi:protein ImuA
LSRVYLLHPQTTTDEAWAVTECLRCRGVGAVIATPQRMSRIEARRFQLAAERGGGVGIFLRQRGRGDSIYAAATRWLIAPHPGERTIQRWTIQLLHGHGGRVGQTVFLEYSRENHSVRAVEKLADRPDPATTEQSAIS